MEKENSTFTTTITSSSPWEIIRREVPDWDDEMTSIARFKAFSGQRSDWEPRYMFWKDLIVKVAKGLGICTVKSSDVSNYFFIAKIPSFVKPNFGKLYLRNCQVL